MSKGKYFASFPVSLPFAEINTQPDFKVSDYKKIFDKFDVDSGGTIDAQELGTLIRGLGLVNLRLSLFCYVQISKYFGMVNFLDQSRCVHSESVNLLLHIFSMQTEPV